MAWQPTCPACSDCNPSFQDKGLGPRIYLCTSRDSWQAERPVLDATFVKDEVIPCNRWGSQAQCYAEACGGHAKAAPALGGSLAHLSLMPNSKKTRSASVSTSAPKQRAAVSEVVPPTALLLTLMAGLSCSRNSVTGVTQHLQEQSQLKALHSTRPFYRC